MIGRMGSGKEECARCGRQLKDPASVARGVGPKCWRLSGGGVFDKDLDVGELEWKRREELLKNGGEIDLGMDWQYVEDGIRHNMRVSVRYREGEYEAYGRILSREYVSREIVFARGVNLKVVYRIAVETGPMCTARAHQAIIHQKRKRFTQRLS